MLIARKVHTFEEAVAAKQVLATALVRALPASYVRRKEWSIDNDLQVSVTACLRRPLSAAIAIPLLQQVQLPQAPREQLLALLTLPAWRHMLRVDQAGGISLYIERDWEYALLAAVCGWFGVSDQPAYTAQQLNQNSKSVVAGIGVHLNRSGAVRLRIYMVMRSRPLLWRRQAENFLVLLSEQFGCRLPRWLCNLVERPRRALVINIEEKNARPLLKLEIPDVAWAEVVNTAALHGNRGATLLAAHPPQRLCYLGSRLAGAAELTTTFYLPYCYPSPKRMNACGLPM